MVSTNLVETHHHYQNDSNFLKRTNFYIVPFKDFLTKIADIWARGIPTFVARSDKTFYKKCFRKEI